METYECALMAFGPSPIRFLRSFNGKYAVIGGAVPWLPLDNHEMPHVGTLDVDVGLDAEALGEGEYARLVETLMGHDYKQSVELGKFQLVRTITPTERGFNKRPARLEIYGFRTFLFSQPLLPRTGLLARNNFRFCPSSGRRRQRASKSGLSMFGLLDYRGWPRRRLHSPRAERMKVKPPSPPSAQSVQTKKKPPVDLAISP
jgi:hypothetical protein